MSILVAGVAAAVLALSACGSDAASPSTASESPSATSGTSAAESTGSASIADVAFAQMMIPHHQQAIDMSQLALDPASGASPSVQQMARQIEAAQAPEIALMEQWLVEWGVPYDPDDADDWPGPNGDDHMNGPWMGNMMGMLRDEQMEELATASGTEFDRLWLEGMIDHHEGAVDMVEMMISDSSNEEVQQLGEQIITSQLAEIEEMEQMLEQLG